LISGLVYDTDRNMTSMLIGADWKLWMIDFSRAFRAFHELLDSRVLGMCDRQLPEKMRRLDEREVLEKTKPHLDNTLVKAIMARRDLLVAYHENRSPRRVRTPGFTDPGLPAGASLFRAHSESLDEVFEDTDDDFHVVGQQVVKVLRSNRYSESILEGFGSGIARLAREYGVQPHSCAGPQHLLDVPLLGRMLDFPLYQEVESIADVILSKDGLTGGKTRFLRDAR
jgi:hypothetical protein